MLVKRQTNESNAKRSESYKRTASEKKLNGHKSEDVFAEAFSGSLVPGTKKPDVYVDRFGFVSVKRASKLQLALYNTDRLSSELGIDNPYAKAATAQRAYYEDRHFNAGQNSKKLFTIAYQCNIDLVEWLNKDDNFVSVLDYVLTNNGEVDYLADMWDTDDSAVYMTKMSDVLEAVKNANPVASVTPSGMRVSVSITMPNQQTRKAFSLEVRSNANHCKGMLFKAESKWLLKGLIRELESCEYISIDK